MGQRCNYKTPNLRLLEENRREILQDISLGKDILDDPKSTGIKSKLAKGISSN
jgi:hypothetical protein